MFLVTCQYGRTNDMPLSKTVRVVAEDEADACAQAEYFLKASGFPFVKVTEVKSA